MRTRLLKKIPVMVDWSLSLRKFLEGAIGQGSDSAVLMS
jgi:hypothetical protein